MITDLSPIVEVARTEAVHHNGGAVFPCAECGSEAQVIADRCMCNDCGESWPMATSVPHRAASELGASSRPLALDEVQRCLTQHPVLGGLNLQFAGRYASRTSEVLEYKRRVQGKSPTFMLKYKKPPLSRAVSEEQATREFENVQELWRLSGDRMRRTLPRPLALLPEIGAAVFERVPGLPLSNFLRIHGNRLTGRLRRSAIQRIGWEAGRWLRELHAKSDPHLVLYDAQPHLAKLAYWLCRALQGGLDRTVAIEVWSSATIAANRNRSVPIPYSQVHGDFIPQNIIVQHDRIGVIDFGSYRGPEAVYEDLGLFLANCHLIATNWVYSPVMADDLQAAFLDGYGDGLNRDWLYLYVMKSMAMIFADQCVPRRTGRQHVRKLERIQSRLLEEARDVSAR